MPTVAVSLRSAGTAHRLKPARIVVLPSAVAGPYLECHAG